MQTPFSHLEEDLKNAIYLKYEMDTGRPGSIDLDILDDETEKHALFEDPTIQELLSELVDGQIGKLKKMKRGKEYREVLRDEFDRLIKEMAMEAEGVVV